MFTVYPLYCTLCGQDQRESVLLFPYCALQRLQACCICPSIVSPRVGKYSTLGNRQVNASIDYSSLPFASITIAGSRHAACHSTVTISFGGEGALPFNTIIIPLPLPLLSLLLSLPFAAINNGQLLRSQMVAFSVHETNKLLYHSLRLPLPMHFTDVPS